MKLSLSFLRRSAVRAGLVLALAAPSIGNAGDHYGPRGWVGPPVTYSIGRMPNTYNYYWNTRLAGVPSGGGLQYPMVYQPTDTTQLGFYYQAVPRWQYRPEMLPPAPAPYWPIGSQSGYGGSWNSGGTVSAPAARLNNGVPANVTPVTPAPPLAPIPPAPVVAPPPPAEPAVPAVNVPEPEAAVFPNRARR